MSHFFPDHCVRLHRIFILKLLKTLSSGTKQTASMGWHWDTKQARDSARWNQETHLYSYNSTPVSSPSLPFLGQWFPLALLRTVLSRILCQQNDNTAYTVGPQVILKTFSGDNLSPLSNRDEDQDKFSFFELESYRLWITFRCLPLMTGLLMLPYCQLVLSPPHHCHDQRFDPEPYAVNRVIIVVSQNEM